MPGIVVYVSSAFAGEPYRSKLDACICELVHGQGSLVTHTVLLSFHLAAMPPLGLEQPSPENIYFLIVFGPPERRNPVQDLVGP